MSMFVAVILDNLELEEDVKKIKQVNHLRADPMGELSCPILSNEHTFAVVD
jgi:hypothetical protein